jgi:ureidoacrylate peracid hydrolase
MRLPARYYSRYPFEAPKGLVETELDLDLAETAFMLVDVYGKGFDPGDAVPDFPGLFSRELHARHATMMRRQIRPARDAARDAGLPVVYVENRWRPASWQTSEFGQLVERTECGDHGRFDEIYIGGEYNAYSEVIAPSGVDYVIEKTMYDGFFETTLDTLLRNLAVKNLICVGFSAEICLLNTVIGAMYRNYRVVVLRDATLGSEFSDTIDEMAMTRWAVRYYEAMVGFTSTVEQFLRAVEPELTVATSSAPERP